jgi:hypothetical protein
MKMFYNENEVGDIMFNNVIDTNEIFSIILQDLIGIKDENN